MASSFDSIPNQSSDGQPPSKKSVFVDLALIAASGLGLGAVIYRHSILPARFFYDGNRIRDIALGIRSSYGDENYEATAEIYRATGLARNELLTGLVGLGLAISLLLVVRHLCRNTPASLTTAIFCGLTVIFSAVYLGYYSKDLVVLVVVATALFANRSWFGDALVVGVMCGYALEFRSYWFLVAAAFALYRFVHARTRGLLWVLITAMLTLFFFAAFFHFVLHIPADYYRTSVNAVRFADPDAGSMIHRVLDGGGFGVELLNVGFVAATLVFPLPLLLAGGSYYAGVSIIIGGGWCCFLAAARRGISERLPDPTCQVRFSRSICLPLSLVTVQALFEPDYGSALRHLTPLMPAMLLVVWLGHRPFSPREHHFEDIGSTQPHPACSRELRGRGR